MFTFSLASILGGLRKRIAILGSTGSIGVNALDVALHLRDQIEVVALSAHTQIEKLIEQIRIHRPRVVAVSDPASFAPLASALKNWPDAPEVTQDMASLARQPDVDMVVAAVVGAAGLPAVLAAAESGKDIALANKESLVVAGSLLIPLAKKSGSKILPVDSEHSAIFQAMQAGKTSEIRRLILTASGGPFRNASLEEINKATPADALNHPTWNMGAKITIDCASMFNKGLELIEACWLFDMPAEKIDIVVHPESVIHSMVEFVDGNVLAQLSPPDMRTPIQYALTYPERFPAMSRKMDWTKPHTLHFHAPDAGRFPALNIARDVASKGGTAGAIMNAANESAVACFLKGQIPFGMIWRAVRHTIEALPIQQNPSLDDLMKADRDARTIASQFIENSQQPSSQLIPSKKN